MKVVLLGASQVGKTSIINRLSVNYQEETVSTIGAAFITKMISTKQGTIQLQIWDTAGQEQYRSMTPMYYRSADIVIFVYDLTSQESFEDIQNWSNEVRDSCSPNVVYALVGNKTDLVDQRMVSFEEGKKLAKTLNASIFKEVSAKSGDGVHSLFQEVAEIGITNPVQQTPKPVHKKESSCSC